MSNEVVIPFEEKQNQPIYIRIGVPALVVAIAIGVQVFDTGASLGFGSAVVMIITMLCIAILVTSPKLITRVDTEKVSIRRRFSIYAKISMHEIKTAEAKSYKDASKEYGRNALFASEAFFYIGEMGVVIHRHEGNPTFVSSKRASELATTILEMRAAFEQSKYDAI